MAHPSMELTPLGCSVGPSSGPCIEHTFRRSSTGLPSILLYQQDDTRQAPSLISPPTSPCHLLKLPIELLLEISAYLELYERALLSLTCKSLYSTFASGSIPHLHMCSQDLLEFLHNLQKDLPSYYLCLSCKPWIFHPHRGIERNSFTLQSLKKRWREAHPNTIAYVCGPHPPRSRTKRQKLYILNSTHISRLLSKQICISILRCTFTYPLLRLDVFPLSNDFVRYTYKTTPVMTRFAATDIVIFHATTIVERSDPATRNIFFSPHYLHKFLQHLDIRCCAHCSTDRFAEEIECLMFHSEGPFAQGRPLPECINTWRRYGSEDPIVLCGRSRHKHSCSCRTEYEVEELSNPYGGEEQGFKVSVWQLVGGERGIYKRKDEFELKKLHADAIDKEEMRISRRYRIN